MKINDKGQVTIPPAMMKKFGLLPNTEVELVEHQFSDHISINKKNVKRKRLNIDAIAGKWRDNSDMTTTDEIMKFLLG